MTPAEDLPEAQARAAPSERRPETGPLGSGAVPPARDRADALAGVLLGTAVGDALGLPREGLSRSRATKLFGGPPLRHHFLFGRGLTRDDTDHACLVGQALLRAPDDARRFARSLAWRLRCWLLGLPAGIGRATLQGIVRLWLGFPPERSGVYSAGNGPAMRAPLLGVCLGDDFDRLRAYVRASTRLTHTDPRAERGALLVALAARHGARRGPHGVHAESYLREARELLPGDDDELADLLDRVAEHLRRRAPAVELADALGLRWGVTGYVYHTVPVALYGWLRARRLPQCGGGGDRPRRRHRHHRGHRGCISRGHGGGWRHPWRVAGRPDRVAAVSRLDAGAGGAPGGPVPGCR